MINEVGIYKSIIDKNYTRAKYLLSDFLKQIYNLLNREEMYGATKKFTMISEAIFYMLDHRLSNYLVWYDYSNMLELANNENLEFPKYLKTNFTQIVSYHYFCPILAKHSNESTLLQIVEKLLKKCVDTDANQKPDYMETDKYEERIENILKVLGPVMVEHGFLQSLPSVSSVDGPFFSNHLNQFVSQVNMNTEYAKQLAVQIPLEIDATSNTLRNCLTYFKDFIKNLQVDNFKSVEVFMGQLMKQFECNSLQSLMEAVNTLNRKFDNLQKDLEYKTELNCTLGFVMVGLFQQNRIDYVNTTNDSYGFYTKIINEYARCYLMRLNPKFYASIEDYNQCKSDENFFRVKLDGVLGFCSKDSTVEQLIEFQNEVTTYVSPTRPSITVETIKSVTEINGEANLHTVYEQTRIFFQLTGNTSGIRGVINMFRAFSEKFGENQNLVQIFSVVENLVSLISNNFKLSWCLTTVKDLLNYSGNGVNSIEEIGESVKKINEVYSKRLKDEEFSIKKLGFDLESFIDQTNTEPYSYIFGKTNSDKLNYVHEHLTKHLHKIDPDIEYSHLVRFIKQAIGDDTSKLDDVTFDTIIHKINTYDSLKEETETLKTNLSSVNEEVKKCNESLSDFKQKYEITNKTNVAYEKEIKQYVDECTNRKSEYDIVVKQLEEFKNKSVKYDEIVHQLDELKKKHNLLQETYQLVQKQFSEYQSKSLVKSNIVLPTVQNVQKKRKHSEEESSGGVAEEKPATEGIN